MHRDLAARKRAVVIVFRRYLEAERSLNDLRRDARTWFPPSRKPGPAAIGNPGSVVRNAYERRARAIAQLEVAILKLNIAKRRLARRRSPVLALPPASVRPG
ncbi:MAG: hypothetical protein AAGF74_11930 [Pseudomonadota bacterium]